MLSVGNHCIIPAISALEQKKHDIPIMPGWGGVPLDSGEMWSCTHLRNQRILYAIHMVVGILEE